MVDQSLFPQNNALKVARNVISVLYLQLRFPIQAPHTIHNQTDHHTHSSGVYAEWLHQHCTDLERFEETPLSGQGTFDRQLQIQREVEKHQLFGMAKMLLSILWQLRNGTGQNTRIESPELTM